MNGSAWAMLLCTWAVVFFFTFKFFIQVLRTPPRADDADDEAPRS